MDLAIVAFECKERHLSKTSQMLLIKSIKRHAFLLENSFALQPFAQACITVVQQEIPTAQLSRD
jgi:hypothetical protein